MTPQTSRRSMMPVMIPLIDGGLHPCSELWRCSDYERRLRKRFGLWDPPWSPNPKPNCGPQMGPKGFWASFGPEGTQPLWAKGTLSTLPTLPTRKRTQPHSPRASPYTSDHVNRRRQCPGPLTKDRDRRPHTKDRDRRPGTGPNVGQRCGRQIF